MNRTNSSHEPSAKRVTGPQEAPRVGRRVVVHVDALQSEFRQPDDLFFDEAYGLDGRKLGEIQSELAAQTRILAAEGESDPRVALSQLTPDKQLVHASSVVGDRKALKVDAYVPAALALIFLVLLLYFRSVGGYRRVSIVAASQQRS